MSQSIQIAEEIIRKSSTSSFLLSLRNTFYCKIPGIDWIGKAPDKTKKVYLVREKLIYEILLDYM